MTADGLLGGAAVGAATRRRGPSAGAVEWLGGVLVAAVVLGPALRPGYLLRYDLVSAPRPVLGDDALGLGDRLPRAVPWDSVVAVVARVLPDALVTQAFALLALAAAAAGAARLARPAGAGRWVALLVAVWNPFVLEQLAIGHVPHLLGYAAVPWAAVGTHRLLTGRAGGWTVLAAACVVGSVTPGGGLLVTGTVLAAGMALAGRVAGGGARLGAALGTALAAQAPWVVAGLAHPGVPAPTPSAATAFATRAESVAGVVADVLGLGGMWAAGPLPPSRSTPLALASTLLLLGLAAAGLPGALRAVRPVPLRVAGVVLVAAGYAVALLPHLPGGRAVLVALAAHVPGAGLLRDGHRWLAWPALAVAVLAGLGARALADAVTSRSRGRLTAAPVLVLVGAAVVAVAPDLALGLGGRLTPVTYPADWAHVRAVLDAAGDGDRDGDRVLVLPWQPFRRFAWSGPAPVLDPAPRILPRPVLVDDALTVAGDRLPAEGAGARAAARALADGVLTPAELAGLRVGWVLVERGTPGLVPALPAPPVASAVVDGPDLRLLRTAAVYGSDPARGPAVDPDVDPLGTVGAGRRGLVVAAHTAYATLAAAAAIGAVVTLGRRFRRVGRRPSPVS